MITVRVSKLNDYKRQISAGEIQTAKAGFSPTKLFPYETLDILYFFPYANSHFEQGYTKDEQKLRMLTYTGAKSPCQTSVTKLLCL